MKSILILGANGMLGSSTCRYYTQKGYDVKSLTRSEFNAVTSGISELESHVEKSDLVLNCIGVIKQVIDKYTPYETVKINGTFPRNLAKLCLHNGTPLIHITTDCAFSGKRGSYNENDYLDAEDLYGISKVAGETVDCMTLRTSIIGPEQDTSLSLLGWVFSQRGKTVNGYTNHLWNGVTTLQFAKITEMIMNKGLYEKGLFHIHSPGSLSKFELVSMISNVFGLGIKVIPEENMVFCDRTLSTVYPLNGNISIPVIEEQLRELKSFFNL
ncbi:MAG: sugar nucleotide-binding protein [Ignavibacteria bacterium]|nr:sugar nucleotide-binding protein [Ignavibacteria bacterium]